MLWSHTLIGPKAHSKRWLSVSSVLLGTVVIWVFKVVLANVWLGLGFGPDNKEGKLEISGEGWLLAGTIGVWLGACLTGRFMSNVSRSSGIVHGMCAWALAAALSLALTRGGNERLAGAAESLLNKSFESATGRGGTAEDSDVPTPSRPGWLNTSGVRWGFVLLGIEIAAAAWGGWAGTASLRRGETE